MICDECETVAHCMKNGCVPKTNKKDEALKQAQHAEIQRLREANKELLDALDNVMYWDNGKPEWDAARAAITKATKGEQA